MQNAPMTIEQVEGFFRRAAEGDQKAQRKVYGLVCEYLFIVGYRDFPTLDKMPNIKFKEESVQFTWWWEPGEQDQVSPANIMHIWEYYHEDTEKWYRESAEEVAKWYRESADY